MSKKSKKITVQGQDITVFGVDQQDFISLTDIAKHKTDDPSAVITNWMRNRNTIEFLGVWESLYNPDFKPLEFEGSKKQAGLNAFTLSAKQISVYAHEADVLNMALFAKTAKEWRDENPDKKGNIRDYANVSQLLCLANLENLNAVFINDGLEQAEIAETQSNPCLSNENFTLQDHGTTKRLGEA